MHARPNGTSTVLQISTDCYTTYSRLLMHDVLLNKQGAILGRNCRHFHG